MYQIDVNSDKPEATVNWWNKTHLERQVDSTSCMHTAHTTYGARHTADCFSRSTIKYICPQSLECISYQSIVDRWKMRVCSPRSAREREGRHWEIENKKHILYIIWNIECVSVISCSSIRCFFSSVYLRFLSMNKNNMFVTAQRRRRKLIYGRTKASSQLPSIDAYFVILSEVPATALTLPLTCDSYHKSDSALFFPSLLFSFLSFVIVVSRARDAKTQQGGNINTYK